MSPRACLAVLLATVLAACTLPPDEQQQAMAQSQRRAASLAATPTAADADALAPPPVDAGACDAEQAQWLVGRTPARSDLQQARKDAGARSVRTLQPGQAVTMEFSAGRLNLDLDGRGAVASVRCG